MVRPTQDGQRPAVPQRGLTGSPTPTPGYFGRLFVARLFTAEKYAPPSRLSRDLRNSPRNGGLGRRGTSPTGDFQISLASRPGSFKMRGLGFESLLLNQQNQKLSETKPRR
jgi:hypothetical protein